MTANTSPSQVLNTATSANNASIVTTAIQSISTGCGTGSGMAALTSTINSATSALNNAINTLTSLPNLIQSQINSVVNSALSNVLGEIRNATDPLLREVNTLLSVLNNPTAFLAQWLRMQNLFPNLNLQQIFDDILRGIGICQAVGNAGGNPPQHPSSTTTAQSAAISPVVPTAPQSIVQPNTSGISQENLPPLPGVRVAIPPAISASSRFQIEVLRINLLNNQISALENEYRQAGSEAERSRIIAEINVLRAQYPTIGAPTVR
jgi:hypothetical protein